MSSINFATFRESAPELSHAWDQLERWIDSHPDVRFLDIRRLARELYPATVWDLTRAIERLRDAGEVDMSYRVVDPSGAILDEDYADFDEIPDQVQDRMRDYSFEVRPKNVLPVYWLEHGQQR